MIRKLAKGKDSEKEGLVEATAVPNNSKEVRTPPSKLSLPHPINLRQVGKDVRYLKLMKYQEYSKFKKIMEDEFIENI